MIVGHAGTAAVVSCHVVGPISNVALASLATSVIDPGITLTIWLGFADEVPPLTAIEHHASKFFTVSGAVPGGPSMKTVAAASMGFVSWTTGASATGFDDEPHAEIRIRVRASLMARA